LLPTAVVEEDQVWLALPQEVEYPL
jgi:hypothetical protein